MRELLESFTPRLTYLIALVIMAGGLPVRAAGPSGNDARECGNEMRKNERKRNENNEIRNHGKWDLD
jgi:hypothetical protein